VDAEANQQPTSERAPGKPGSFKESVSQLARTDWPLKQQLDRERLAGLVREWVEAQLAVIVNLPVGEKDKPVDRIASQTKLGDALSGMLGERQALSDGDEAWAVEEPKGGVFAFWKSMTELQARADSIVKLGGSAGLPADLEKELRAAFVGTADGLLDRQVQRRGADEDAVQRTGPRHAVPHDRRMCRRPADVPMGADLACEERRGAGHRVERPLRHLRHEGHAGHPQ
jgi:hypothetical protein